MIPQSSSLLLHILLQWNEDNGCALQCLPCVVANRNGERNLIHGPCPQTSAALLHGYYRNVTHMRDDCVSLCFSTPCPSFPESCSPPPTNFSSSSALPSLLRHTGLGEAIHMEEVALCSPLPCAAVFTCHSQQLTEGPHAALLTEPELSTDLGPSSHRSLPDGPPAPQLQPGFQSYAPGPPSAPSPKPRPSAPLRRDV